MPIEMLCPKCHSVSQYPLDMAGLKAKCRKCGEPGRLGTAAAVPIVADEPSSAPTVARESAGNERIILRILLYLALALCAIGVFAGERWGPVSLVGFVVALAGLACSAPRAGEAS